MSDTARVKVAVVAVALSIVLAGCSSASGSASSTSTTGQESSPVGASTSASADTFTLVGQVTVGEYGVDSTQPDPKPCYGTFGFSDIKVGQQVVVTAKGQTVALGSLTQSLEDATEKLCALKIEVPDVPGGMGFYQLMVGKRDAPQLTEAAARQTVKLSLG